jgi:hypothetical protein
MSTPDIHTCNTRIRDLLGLGDLPVLGVPLDHVGSPFSTRATGRRSIHDRIQLSPVVRVIPERIYKVQYSEQQDVIRAVPCRSEGDGGSLS